MGKGYSLKMRAGSTTEAELYIYEDIGAGFFGGLTSKDVAADLKSIGDVKVINVRINSGGGDVFDGTAIHSLLKAHPAKIIVHIDGLAASIASVIAMAGDEIRIAEAGFLMIHNAAGVVIGGAEDMRAMADVLEKVQGSIVGIYAERTGKDPAELQALMNAETWMTGEEAVKAGFCDEMVANLHIAARVDPIKHQFKHTPTALTEAPAAETNIVRPRFQAASDAIALMGAKLRRTPVRSA